MSTSPSAKRKRTNQGQERAELSERIGRIGFNVDIMPCSYCFDHNLKCVMAIGVSKKCSECVLHRRQCDGTGIPIGSFSRLENEEERLSVQERQAEEALERLHTEMAEALARVKRLRRQKELLKEKGLKMLQRGLQSLEELEEQEQSEKEQRPAGEQQYDVKAQASAASAVDPFSDFSLEDVNFDLPPSVDLGSGGGNPQSTSGPSHS